MLAAFMGLGLWLKVAVAAGVLAIVVGGAWAVHHSIWKSGYTAAEAKYKPIIDKAKSDLVNSQADLKTAVSINAQFEAELRRLQDVLKVQQASIDTFRQEALVAEINLRKTLLSIAAKEKRYTAEIARLLSIVSGPTLTEGDCEEADSILRTLVRDRMRDAGTPPAAGSGSAQGGTSRGSGGSPLR